MIFGLIIAVVATVVAAVVTAVEVASLVKAKVDADKNFSKKPAGKSVEPCDLEVKLVELVEVVRTDATMKDKPAKGRKQYINLKKDIEAGKAHPEYDEYIELKARVEWVRGDKSRSLSGNKVYFYFKPDASNKSGLDTSHTEGVGSHSAPDKKSISTDAEGWTPIVKCYLSKFGGDKFDIFATDKSDYSGGLKAGQYEVWRKLWYQMTRDKDFAVPKPTDSEKYWKEVFVESAQDNVVTFKKADAPARTYYPQWMVDNKGGDKQVAVIGGHNKTFFRGKLTANPACPLKAHLVMCEYQWDPGIRSDTYTDKLTVDITSSPSSSLTMSLPIMKPALKGDLVKSGKWTLKKDATKTGALTLDNILVEKGRGGYNEIKVKLPAGAPTPTASAPVSIELVLRAAAGPYLGESAGIQILAVYDSSDEPDYNDTVTHEMGHSVNQTPVATKQPKGLPDHPTVHIKRGGTGPHCHYGATESATSTDEDGKKNYVKGKCVMYLGYSSKGEHKFCTNCVDYVKLQDMRSLS